MGSLGKYPKGHEKSAGVQAEVVQGSRHSFPGVLLGLQPLLAKCRVAQGQSGQSGVHVDIRCRTVVFAGFSVVTVFSLPYYRW